MNGIRVTAINAIKNKTIVFCSVFSDFIMFKFYYLLLFDTNIKHLLNAIQINFNKIDEIHIYPIKCKNTAI